MTSVVDQNVFRNHHRRYRNYHHAHHRQVGLYFHDQWKAAETRSPESQCTRSGLVYRFWSADAPTCIDFDFRIPPGATILVC